MVHRPWARTNLNTGEYQALAPMRNNGGRFCVFTIQPLGDGSRMLIADQYGMWVLTMPPPH